MGAGYSQGPLQLGAGYLNVRNANVGFFGNSSATALTAATANATNPVISGFMSAHTYQVISASGAYTCSLPVIEVVDVARMGADVSAPLMANGDGGDVVHDRVVLATERYSARLIAANTNEGLPPKQQSALAETAVVDVKSVFKGRKCL
ncbi:hypothetical protein CR51_36530 [Caballeronia megalochromosomata]|nr:hypothetical protein CR51_36530 [Caballeronia megalochromosomata]